VWARRDDGNPLSLLHQLPDGLPLMTVKCVICMRSPVAQPPFLAFSLESGGRGNTGLFTNEVHKAH
jgi:hypothetical protein